MRQYYYMNARNEQVGPVDGSQLAAYGVNANTMVWAQGMPGWVAAGTVDELAHIFRPVAAAPMPTAAPMAAPAAAPMAAAVPQTVTYIQTGPSGYGQQQPMMPKPNSHMTLAVLSTLFCCLITGIIAIVYASKVDGRYFAGDYAGAKSASDWARNWSIIGMIGSVIISTIYLFVYGGALVAGLSGAFK